MKESPRSRSRAATPKEPIPPANSGLNELGEKIFLDRYALKDGSKKSLAVGDTVVVCTDVKTGQREIGSVTALNEGVVTVQLRDGTAIGARWSMSTSR